MARRIGTYVVVEAGLAACIREPINGEHGLEGYNLGETYRYQVVQGPRGRHARVWPDGEDGASPDYYETCGPDTFLKFFRPEGKP